MRRLSFICLLAISIVRTGGAQSSGTISGTVTDATGAVLPGVEIIVTNAAVGLNRSAVSNERGDYVVPLLPVGTYDIRAELPGFKVEVHPNIALQVDQRLVLHFNLQVGEVTEHLFVTDAAPLV